MTVLQDTLGSFVIPITSGFSGLLELRGQTIVEFFTPAAWTGATALVPYSCGTRDGTFLPMYDDLGNAITHLADANRAISCDELIYAHRRYIKFKSDGQAAARTVQYRTVSLQTLIRAYAP